MVRLSCCLQNSGLTARLHDSTSSPSRSADRSLSREASTASAGTKTQSNLPPISMLCVCRFDRLWPELVFLTLCGDWRLCRRGSHCDWSSLIRQWTVSASCHTALTVASCCVTQPPVQTQNKCLECLNEGWHDYELRFLLVRVSTTLKQFRYPTHLMETLKNIYV